MPPFIRDFYVRTKFLAHVKSPEALRLLRNSGPNSGPPAGRGFYRCLLGNSICALPWRSQQKLFDDKVAMFKDIT